MAKKKLYDESGNEVKGKGGCLKWIGIAVLVLIALGAIGSLVGGDTDTTADDSASTAESQVVSSEKAESSTESESEVEVPEELPNYTATEIIDTFEANELKGKETYTGKKARITGTVNEVSEILDQVFVTLSTDSDPYSFIALQVFINEDSPIKPSDLVKDQVITVEGKIGEQSINIEVRDAIIVE